MHFFTLKSPKNCLTQLLHVKTKTKNSLIYITVNRIIDMF